MLPCILRHMICHWGTC